MDITFSFDHKERLARRIERLKKNLHYFKIVDIVFKYNDVYDIENKIMINNNSSYLYFHDLTNITYSKIEEFLDSIFSQSNTASSENKYAEYKPYSQCDIDNEYMNKYNNHERNIIKKIMHDEEKNNDCDNIESNSSIFVKKFKITQAKS